MLRLAVDRGYQALDGGQLAAGKLSPKFASDQFERRIVGQSGEYLGDAMAAQDGSLRGKHQSAADEHAQEVFHLAGIERDIVEHYHCPHLPQQLRALLGCGFYGGVRYIEFGDEPLKCVLKPVWPGLQVDTQASNTMVRGVGGDVSQKR